MTEWRPRPERMALNHGVNPPQKALGLRQRRRVLVGLLAGCALLAIPSLTPPAPRLLWNASASAPIGFYLVMPGVPLGRGDWVVAWAPPRARALAAVRHYLPANVPLVKRVRAIAGDRVCASGRAIFIDGHPVARQRTRDHAGRPMPSWRGCVTLADGQFFLLNDPADSFDGRYFGPTKPDEVIGKASPVCFR